MPRLDKFDCSGWPITTEGFLHLRRFFMDSLSSLAVKFYEGFDESGEFAEEIDLISSDSLLDGLSSLTKLTNLHLCNVPIVDEHFLQVFTHLLFFENVNYYTICRVFCKQS